MFSGNRVSVVIQASADTPNTPSPTRTHGEVAAATGNDDAWPALTLSAAPCMPYFSINWPLAAEPTANSSSTMVAADIRAFLGAARRSATSGSFDNDDLLGVRGQPQDELVAEEGRPHPDEQVVDRAHRAQLQPVRLRQRAERQAGRAF